MLRIATAIACLSLLGLACAPSPDRLPEVAQLQRPVRFLEDVKPVLDTRCVVCHSCYNAALPAEAELLRRSVERGGSKKSVYSSSRLRPAAADATLHRRARRRTVGGALEASHSVIQSRAQDRRRNDSTMLYLFLEAKRLASPFPSGEYRSEASSNLSCPATPPGGRGLRCAAIPNRGHALRLSRAASDEEHGDSRDPGWQSGRSGSRRREEQAELDHARGRRTRAEIEKWESLPESAGRSEVRDDRPPISTSTFFWLICVSAETDSGRLLRPRPVGRRPPDEPIVRGQDRSSLRRPGHREGLLSLPEDPLDDRSQDPYADRPGMTTRLARYQRACSSSRNGSREPSARCPIRRWSTPIPSSSTRRFPPLSRYSFLLDHSDYIIQHLHAGAGLQGAGRAQRRSRSFLGVLHGPRGGPGRSRTRIFCSSRRAI